MKVAVLLACAVLTTNRISCAAINAPLDIISLDDISESDRKTLEYLDQHYPRPKRSHDYDILNSLKSAVGNGIKSKLGLIAKGSASAVSHFSSGSSGGGHSYHHYDVPETYDHKSFDFWSLKKSILNTLLQAVKAIKGGVIAIKGQLIKGSGYLISAKGKLISAKGEAITSLGKNIAGSAVLSPYPHHNSASAPAHIEYVAPHGHGHYHSSGPSEEYGSPSAPGPEYEVPNHHHPHPLSHHEDKPDPDHAGILILKKIPSDHDGHSEHHSDDHPRYVPDFKPLESTGPSFGTIVGKFFSASTSLKPGEPAPFGDSGAGQSAYHSHDHHHHSEASHDHHDHEHEHQQPEPSHDHSTPNHHESHVLLSHENHAPSSSSHEHVEYYPSQAPNGPPKLPSGPPSAPPSGPPSELSGPPEYMSPPSVSSSSGLKPPSTSYGTPFEEAPAYLNYAEYTAESIKNPQTIVHGQKAQEPGKSQSNPIVYDKIKPLAQALTTSHGLDSSSSLTTNSFDKPNLFIGTKSNKPNDLFPPYSTQVSSTAGAYNLESFAQFGGFNSPAAIRPDVKYLSPPTSSLFYPYYNFNSIQSLNSQPTYSIHSKYKSQTSSKFPSSVLKAPPKRPQRSKLTVVEHKKPNIDVIKSIAFELGPNGPKRL